MKAYEIYSAAAPSVVNQMLDWFRSNDRNVYKSAVASLAEKRKLRPVFIEKKPMTEQYAWIHKTLKISACNTIGEHLMQAYLMAGQQSLLAMFCDGMGIQHDGKGSVVGELPEALDAKRLDSTIDRLIEVFDPKILTLYLNHVEWGTGVFGAEAAARHYFQKSASQLTEWEAARLAVMLPRPRYFEKLPQSVYLSDRAQTIMARMNDVAVP